MEKDQASTSGDATATASGVGNETESTVPRGHVDKILKEKQNYASRVKELEAKLSELEEGKLQEQNQYKELAEKRLEQLKELETFKTQTMEQMERVKKVSAVKSHLKSLGLKPEHEDVALNKLLDVSKLMVDPDTGVVLGAEELAKEFRTTYAGLGIFGKNVPGTNHDAPSSSSPGPVGRDLSKMTAAELKAEMIRLKSQS